MHLTYIVINLKKAVKLYVSLMATKNAKTYNRYTKEEEKKY